MGVFIILWCAGGQQGTAQIVNGDFESYTCTSFPTEAFQRHPGFVPPEHCALGSWFVSHGTPDLHSNFAGHYAYIWCSASEGEGLYVQCPTFEVGKTYRLVATFYAEAPVDHIYIALTSGLTHNANLSNFSPPTVTRQIVGDVVSLVSGFTTGTPYTVSFSFSPSSNYTQLWFYPTTSLTGMCGIRMDDVVLTTECEATAVYTAYAPSGTPELIERSDYITASGTSRVASGEQVTFKAGNYIRLLPNFRAHQGGYFRAHIAPCVPPELQSCNDNYTINKASIPHQDGPVETIAARTTLLSNYPNPFSGTTMIAYNIHESGPVKLTVQNIFGEQVAVLVNNGNHGTGNFRVEFDASQVPPGTYYYTLGAGSYTMTRKMIVIP